MMVVKDGGDTEGGMEGNIATWKNIELLPAIPNVNFASLFLSLIKKYGANKALIDATTNRSYRYSDILVAVPRVCERLRTGGVTAGDRVLVLSTSNIDYPIALLSVILIPATCVPINPSNVKPEDVIHAVRVSGARWCVVEEGWEGVVEAVTPLLPPNTFRKTWTIANNKQKQQQQQYEELVNLEEKEKGMEEEKWREGDSVGFDYSKTVALMPFSSGTTGLPKGVMISHCSLTTIVMQNRCIAEGFGSPEVDGVSVFARVLLIIPLQHIYGTNFLVTTLLSGNQLIVLDRFTPRKFLESIERHKITFTPIVPHIINYLVHSPLLKEYDISSLFALGSGSAPLPVQDAEALIDKIGVGIGNGYGLTETCAPACTNNTRLGFRAGSVGRPLPYRKVKIVKIDDKSNHPLPVGEEGEVMIGGPGLMLGYSPSLPTTPTTGSPISVEGEGVEGGWIRTGDIGYLDEDGFLFLTDRLKDVIKVKGMQVYPSEIESVLREVEGVGEVAVIGVPSTRLGEAPRGYVVPSPGVHPPPSPDKLVEYVKGRLPLQKQLSGGLEIVKQLPKNSLGKILKRELKKEFIKRMNTATTATTTTATTATGAATKKASKL